MKEKTKQRLKNIARIVSGGLIGTLDVLTTGLPLATLGIPVYDAMKMEDSIERIERLGPRGRSMVDRGASFKEWGKSLPLYFASAAIPFGIKYSSEIYELVSNLNH